MTVLNSGLREKYTNQGTGTYGVGFQRLYLVILEQETHYRMSDATEEKMDDNEARLDH
jgi:hypothetical protein